MSSSRSNYFYDYTILPPVVNNTLSLNKSLKEVGDDLRAQTRSLEKARKTESGKVVWEFNQLQGADHDFVLSTLLSMDTARGHYAYDLTFDGPVGKRDGTRTILVVTFSESVTVGLLDGTEKQVYNFYS